MNQSNVPETPAAPRRTSLLFTVGLTGFALLVLLFFPPLRYRLSLRSPLNVQACFHDVMGLREGGDARIAGVKVGYVRRVLAVPQAASCPARVQMVLQTDYDLRVPSDCLATIQQDGVLGGSYVNLDCSHASGSPLADWGTLPARDPERFDAKRLVEFFTALATQNSTKPKKDAKEPLHAPPTKTR